MDKQDHNGIRQGGIIPVKITENYHTCTCLFPDNRIAVVHVQGAPNQKEARAHVRSVWYPCSYEVGDGDLSGGHIEPFYLYLPTRGTSHDEPVQRRASRQPVPTRDKERAICQPNT